MLYLTVSHLCKWETKKDPSTEPCGTLALINNLSDTQQFNFTTCRIMIR